MLAGTIITLLGLSATAFSAAVPVQVNATEIVEQYVSPEGKKKRKKKTFPPLRPRFLVPKPNQAAHSEASDLIKRGGSYRAYLSTQDCSGNSDFRWDAQDGCFSFNQNRDLYSVLLSDVNTCQSGNYRVRMYTGSFRCEGGSGVATGGGGRTCFHNSGKSFKSFRVSCA